MPFFLHISITERSYINVTSLQQPITLMCYQNVMKMTAVGYKWTMVQKPFIHILVKAVGLNEQHNTFFNKIGTFISF